MSRRNNISTAFALALGLFGSNANAEDQVRSYFLNDVPRMKAECRNAGGTWQGTSCSYPRGDSYSSDNDGGSFFDTLFTAIVIGGAIAVYCGADEENCASSSSK